MPTREQRNLVTKAERNGRDAEVFLLVAFFKAEGHHDLIADAIASVLANDCTQVEKLLDSHYPLPEKLTAGQLADLISLEYADPTGPRPILDWRSVINRGRIA